MNRLKNSVIAAAILLIITLLSYGQTLQMYFLIDDNALIYKLQHPEQEIGLWGSGIVGDGPYRHRVLQFVPFYPIFKTNPTPYFAVGVLLYFLAAVTLFIFVAQITQKKSVGFAAAAIFASGYIGSETMFGITNSWETNRGIIMALITFILYYRFLTTKKIIFYILSVILFFFSLDTIYVRAHGLIFAFIAFDILFGCKDFSFREIVKSVVRLSPFLAVYYKIYLANAGGEIRRFGLWNIIQSAIYEGKLAPLTILLQDIGNLFVPDILTSRIDRMILNYRTLPAEFSVGSLFSGASLMVLMLFMVLKFREKVHLVKIFIFAAIFSLSNFVLFYFREPEHTLWTTHRYFSYSFIGLALFWAIIFYLISTWKNKALFGLFSIGIIILYLWIGMSAQYDFNQKRSLPARKFFFEFVKSVPNIPKGGVLYFSVADIPKVQNEFGSFFGGMFSEASNFAIYTEGADYMSDFIFTYKLDEAMQLINEGKTGLDKFYGFYYGKTGLVDLTKELRLLLASGKTVNIDAGNFSSTTENYVGNVFFTTETRMDALGGKTKGYNPVIKILPPKATPSMVQSQINLTMKVTPKNPDLPYTDTTDNTFLNSEVKEKIFAYLASRNNFLKNSTATSASFWKEQKAQFAIDGRLDTAWRGHRGFWDNIDRGITNDIEYFSVDLGNVLTIGQVRWISAQKPLVPTRYKILTSLDGDSWKIAKEVSNKTELSEGTVVTDSFPPVQARFVKMEILKTYGNDGPELKEFEVIEARFSDLNSEDVNRVKLNPFADTKTITEAKSAKEFILENSKLKFYWMADDDKEQSLLDYREIPLIVDGNFHEIKIDLPAEGLFWQAFSLEGFNFPAEIVIGQVRIIYEPIEK